MQPQSVLESAPELLPYLIFRIELGEVVMLGYVRAASLFYAAKAATARFANCGVMPADRATAAQRKAAMAGERVVA